MKYPGKAVNRMAIMPARETRNFVNLICLILLTLFCSLVDLSEMGGNDGESDLNASLYRNPRSLYTV